MGEDVVPPRNHQSRRSAVAKLVVTRNPGVARIRILGVGPGKDPAGGRMIPQPGLVETPGSRGHDIVEVGEQIYRVYGPVIEGDHVPQGPCEVEADVERTTQTDPAVANVGWSERGHPGAKRGMPCDGNCSLAEAVVGDPRGRHLAVAPGLADDPLDCREAVGLFVDERLPGAARPVAAPDVLQHDCVARPRQPQRIDLEGHRRRCRPVIRRPHHHGGVPTRPCRADHIGAEAHAVASGHDQVGVNGERGHGSRAYAPLAQAAADLIFFWTHQGGATVIKVIGTAYKRDDFTTREFFDYWMEVHGPISARAPGLRGYVVSEVIRKLQGEVETEAFVEQWFDDEEAFERAAASPELAAAWDDVPKYAKTTGTFWLVKEHVIIPPPDRGPGLVSTWKEWP